MEIHGSVDHIGRKRCDRFSGFLVDSLQIKVESVSQRVHSLVGAARNIGLHRMRHKFPQRSVDAALYRVLIGLFLHAREACPEVLKGRKISLRICIYF